MAIEFSLIFKWRINPTAHIKEKILTLKNVIPYPAPQFFSSAFNPTPRFICSFPSPDSVR